MITNNDVPVTLLKVGASTYPMAVIAFNAFDALDGTTVSIKSNATLVPAVTAHVVALYTGEEDIAAEIVGTSHFFVNTGLDATKKLGTLTLKFDTYKENTFSIKAGATVGATTFPSVMPPQIAIVFATNALNIKQVRMTRRNHPTAI